MANRTNHPVLTVAFCTRGRTPSLRVSLAALLDDLDVGPVRAEVLVVDDGTTEPAAVSGMAGEARARGHRFVHVAKEPRGTGLFESRRVAVDLATTPVVLFLDDDADVSGGYCAGLLAHLGRDPSLAGVGGVDTSTLPRGFPPLGRQYARLFALAGDGPGLLSATGMNHSQATWRLQEAHFESEYLHGCNMAFRRSALVGLPASGWLSGHSPCEDLVLSAWARRRGKLLVDPALRVAHRHVPGGRGDTRERLTARLVSCLRFSRTYAPCAPHAMAWSVMGMFAKDMAKAVLCRRPRAVLATASAYAVFAGKAARMRREGSHA